MADFLVARRALLCLPGALALAACTVPGRSGPGGRSSPSAPAVRTDREPLTKRFPALGDFTQAHWQGWAVAGSGAVPGPTDIVIQALVTLNAQDLATARSGYDWQPPPSGRELRINEQLRPFVPVPADWRYSRQFEMDIKTAFYGGIVQLDIASGTVFLHVTSM